MPATRAFAMLLRSCLNAMQVTCLILSECQGVTHKEREKIENSGDGQHPSVQLPPDYPFELDFLHV